MVKSPNLSVLGQDPFHRKNRINSNSFQQNAITTSEGWQYAVFYTDATPEKKEGSCYPNIARRKIGTGAGAGGEWDVLTFNDYEQTRDDGHDVISIAVCKGDGTIHMAFDSHCDQLNFKITKPNAHKASWETSIFSPTQNFLPGIPRNELAKEVTYPTFLNIDNDLLFSYRIGEAGNGSDILYRYSSETHLYTYLGQYLTGVSNSPYVNGIDYRLSRLHISWCYRNFVTFAEGTAPDAHKGNAGPNGPENNHDLLYAFSEDLGITWKNTDGDLIAQLGSSEVEATIKPGAKGARVFEIPMGSGILNQEAQVADWEGGFWALNRENGSGSQKWVVYYRDPNGNWSKTVIDGSSQPTVRGNRASIAAGKNNDVYLVLPGNTDSSLSILQGGSKDGAVKFESIWQGAGFDGEPLVDVQRLEDSEVLSVFTRTDKNDEGKRDVVVLDFDTTS